jgi:hypothetical protein
VKITGREKELLRRALDKGTTDAEAATAAKALVESLRKRGVSSYDAVPADRERPPVRPQSPPEPQPTQPPRRKAPPPDLEPRRYYKPEPRRVPWLLRFVYQWVVILGLGAICS